MSNENKIKDYMENNVKKILQPMIGAVLLEKPKDPVLFMMKWLRNYSGVQSIAKTIEQTELENLRSEIKKYKVKYANDDKEMEVPSDEENEVTPEEQKKIDEELKNLIKNKKKRKSISAEVYGIINKKEDFKPKINPKNAEQKKRIEDKIMQNFIFNSFEEKEIKQIIDAFEEKKFKAGDTVVKQGDESDSYYIIDVGELDCEQITKLGEPAIHIREYKPGDSFGDISLLYNTPRPATIKATSDCICWTINRHTFKYIINEAAIKKRERYEDILKRVDLLNTLELFEIGQLCDALKPEKLPSETIILPKGEIGNKFYIIDEGKAYSLKYNEEIKAEDKDKDYSSGSFFGEFGLYNHKPNPANIKTATDCKFLVLERSDFKRLLGPIEILLLRNSNSILDTSESK